MVKRLLSLTFVLQIYVSAKLIEQKNYLESGLFFLMCFKLYLSLLYFNFWQKKKLPIKGENWYYFKVILGLYQLFM